VLVCLLERDISFDGEVKKKEIKILPLHSRLVIALGFILQRDISFGGNFSLKK
jgi:hypothetical protein